MFEVTMESFRWLGGQTCGAEMMQLGHGDPPDSERGGMLASGFLRFCVNEHVEEFLSVSRCTQQTLFSFWGGVGGGLNLSSLTETVWRC